MSVYGREAAGSGISSSGNNLLNLLKSVVPLAALFTQAKHDPVKSLKGMSGGPRLWAALTQPERQAAAYVTRVM